VAPGAIEALHAMHAAGLIEPLLGVDGNVPLTGRISAIEGALGRAPDALLRLAVHAHLRFLGSHDWYVEVAKSVMKAQKADGAFGDATSDTCEALRFLMRTSLASNARALGEPEDAAHK